jgi:hypothetical protein
MMELSIEEWIGSLGVFLLLLAYVLNLLGVTSRVSRSYQSMNAIGAGIACYASYRIGFMPFVVLEAVWTLTSLVALAGAARGQREPA